LNTPGFWYHDTCPISFTLIVDNFSVKYINKHNVKHLNVGLKIAYTVMEDWAGDLYCSIVLDWDYINRTVDISMLAYIKKKYKNTDILSQTGPKNAHTHLNSRSLILKHKPPSNPMIHQNWM
jgi:hypothetical protein